MVGKIKRWIKDVFGISALERENVQLSKTILAHTTRMDDERKESVEYCDSTNKDILDHESRIAFLESLPKPEKASPKPHKTTFRQFAAAASEATEEKE